jgi:epidermal growth factor receptor substrate 15
MLNAHSMLILESRDLSDMNKDGRLTRDGFAVAFHLIQSKLAGKALPTALPPSLVPPSHRGNAQPAPSPQQPVQETINDLLWDESPPSSATPATQPTQPPLQPQRTGTLNATTLQPHVTGPNQPPIQPQRTGPQLAQSIPIFPHSTGGPARLTTSPDPFTSSVSHDFLSDDEPSVPAPPLEDKSAEIGNLHNQLNSTNRSLNTVVDERADIEQRLAEQATELANLQTQLTAAKAAYETETKLLATLRERYGNQNADISKTRQDLITAESDVSALRLEKNEVQNALLRDKEEVRELQKKMATAGAEIETIKVEIEKTKKEAKQQKGLLAIAKKQLTTREAEKAKVESERSATEAELAEAIKEKDEAEAELAKEVGVVVSTEVPAIGHDIIKPSSPDVLAAAVSQPLPDTPGGSVIGSPSLRSSSIRGTNPFERLTNASPPPSQSPFIPFSSSTGPPVSAQLKEDGNVEVNLDDPFGLGTSRVEEPQPMNEATETNIARDRATSPSSFTEGDDLFVTPSASADTTLELPKGPEHLLTPPEVAVSKPAPGIFSEELDSAAPTKGVPADEDSSDDDGGPEEAIAAQKQNALGAPSPVPPEVSKKSSLGSSFDDAFGVGSETSASIISMPSTVTPNQTDNDAPKPPPQPALSTGTNPLSVSTTSDEPADKPNDVVAGKSAFDEAMGVISSSQPPTNPTFGFDSAFDDDFDFAAAKADLNTSLVPTPATVPTQPHPTTDGAFNPFPPAPTSIGSPPNANRGFDNAFGVDNFSPAPGPASGPPTITLGQDKEHDKPFSFDTVFGTTTTEAPTRPETTGTETKSGALHPNLGTAPTFAGDRTSKALALFSAFGSGPIPQMPGSPASQVQFPRPSTSPPPQRRSSSPPPGSNGSIQSHHDQPSSKLTPPKPRPTTADKLKEKEHPTRTSRLSVSLKLLYWSLGSLSWTSGQWGSIC